MSREKPVVYVGVFLDEASKARLLAAVPPKHPMRYAHHVTVIYKPTRAAVAYLDVGRQVEFSAVAVVEDECAQAVAVIGVASENEVAHVTVSTAAGTFPAYSNELFKRKDAAVLPQAIPLTGVVDTWPSRRLAQEPGRSPA